MAADVPHVSFLGFEAVLSRLDRDALAMAPAARVRWSEVDPQGNEHGHQRIDVERGDKAWEVSVETRLTGLDGDALVVQTTAALLASAPFALRSWSVETFGKDARGQARSAARRVESGRIKGTKMKRDGTVHPPPTLTDRPVCAPWAFGLLAEHDFTLDAPPLRVVDAFSGLGAMRRNLRWQAIGKVVWQEVPLRGWRLTGPDQLPRHVWCGPNGAVLFDVGLERMQVRRRLLGGRG